MNLSKNPFFFLFVTTLILVGSFANYQIALAVTGEGTATIAVDGIATSSAVTVAKGTSHKFTIVLMVGDSGITANAENPIFTIPTGFTVDVNPVAAGSVVTDGNWSVIGGGTCLVNSSSGGLTAASGNVITVDVMTDCTVDPIEGKITLTYKGTSAVAMGATPLNIGVNDVISAHPVTPISAPPTITVVDTANIAIASAKITSANTVLVTMTNPGQDLTSVDYLKWHIDVNNTGIGSLTPASADLTAAGTPWTITLTFADTPFASTSKSYDAGHGLYVEASGVTDANGDTNVVVGNDASTAITDGQAPTFVSAVATSNTNVQITFSELITIAIDTAFKIDKPEYAVEGRGTGVSIVDGDNTKINVTVSALNNTAYTSSNLDILAGGVSDLASPANAIVEDLNNPITDGQVPTITIVSDKTTLKKGEVAALTFTLSESAVNFATGDVVVAGGLLSAFTGTGATYTATFTPTDNSTTLATIDVAALTFTDSAGNNNTVAPQKSMTVNTVAPTLTSAVFTDDTLGVGETSLVTFTFSESITGFTNADLTIVNGELSAVTDAGAGTIWTATFTPTVNVEDATNVITVAMTGVANTAGNAGVGSIPSSNYALDTIPPAVPAVTNRSGSMGYARTALPVVMSTPLASLPPPLLLRQIMFPTTTVPKLPKAGFAPKENNTPGNVIILLGGPILFLFHLFN